MSKKLVDSATQLSRTFMPAERSQSQAAVAAARTLVVALESRNNPEFSNAASDAVLDSLMRGITLSVEADTALREAHRKFAKLARHTGLPELGWGCEEPACAEPMGIANVEPIRAVA